MKDYEKMTLKELWAEYQKLGMENAQMNIKISTNDLNRDSIVSWIMGKFEDLSGDDIGDD